MSAHEQNPKEKAAVLTLKLRADSGYEADAEYRVSAEQWAEALGVCEGTRPVPAEQPVTVRPIKALADGWISIADAMPSTQQQVDIAYIDHHGNPQTTMGWYCRAKTLESSSFEGEVDDEYDEKTDTYYMKEQWVDESQESEYHYPITGVTHWKPRAKHPDFNPQAKGD